MVWCRLDAITSRVRDRWPGAVARLNTELLKALQAPDTHAKLSATEVIGGTPQEFASYVKAELENFGRIVKLLGLKPE